MERFLNRNFFHSPNNATNEPSPRFKVGAMFPRKHLEQYDSYSTKNLTYIRYIITFDKTRQLVFFCSQKARQDGRVIPLTESRLS